MDSTAPQPSPLLLQMSNTASNEARRHWLLEKRLTAPLPGSGVEHDAVNQSGEITEPEEVRAQAACESVAGALSCRRVQGSLAKRARLSGPLSLPAFQAAWPESASARPVTDSIADTRQVRTPFKSCLPWLTPLPKQRPVVSQAADMGRGYPSGSAPRAVVPPFGASDGSALVQVRALLNFCCASGAYGPMFLQELTTQVTTLRGP